MAHIPPFDAVRRTLEISTFKGELRVGSSYDAFVEIIKKYVRLIGVDEEWYLATYPDVSRAIADGAVASAREHYAENGYFEGRLPAAPRVEEAWYLSERPHPVGGLPLHPRRLQGRPAPARLIAGGLPDGAGDTRGCCCMTRTSDCPEPVRAADPASAQGAGR